MSRHEITKHQWKIMKPLLPKRKTHIGRPPVPLRKVLNGIIYVLKTGCAWMDMPKKYGSYTTCWRRLKEWQRVGIWERIWRKLLQTLNEKHQLNWNRVYLDGTFVPAKRGGTEIGKTKSGKGSKLMMVAEQNGIPIGILLSSAQPHEIRLAQRTLASIRVPSKRGRPHSRFNELVADRAYHSQAFRSFLRKKGIKPTIPGRKSDKKRKGRPLAVGDGYKQRWKIERCFAWMDNNRRLIVRYERYIQHYKAFCLISLILLCVNRLLK
jgi:transposase